MKIALNNLEGKWFVDYRNKAQPIAECQIQLHYEHGVRVFIRGKETSWHLAQWSDDGYVRCIGEEEDCIEYAKTLKHREIVKSLFCEYIVKGEPVQQSGF